MTSRRSSYLRLVLAACFAAALWAPAPQAAAEEIWLFSNARLYGLVQGVSKDGNGLEVLMPDGQVQGVPLEDIIAIRFLGRNPLLVQSGTQEFRFVNGGQLRGQIRGNDGDLLNVQTALAGPMKLNLSHFKGFVSLPLVGFSGRKAEELVESDRVVETDVSDPKDKKPKMEPRERFSQFIDKALNLWGSEFDCVLRKFTRTTVMLDFEQFVKAEDLPLKNFVGFRMADAARDPFQPWKGDVQLRLWARDGSRVQGHLGGIHLGKWNLKPLWDQKNALDADLDEISLVQILGGKVQYLSQLTPVELAEKTILAPPQPYRMDRSCQGDYISIAGKRYPWGIGVHADSTLVFDLNARFKTFRSDVGIATRMGTRGSVVFEVLGDGKSLHKTEIVKGGMDKPLTIEVSVEGINKLTLKVTNGGDLDLGDVANWGSARVMR